MMTRFPRAHTRLTSACGIALLAGLISDGAVGQIGAQDPRIGTWRLVELKNATGGSPPTSSVWTYAYDGGEWRVDVHSISPTGRPLHWFYTTLRDGSESRVRGNPTVDFITVTPQDERTDQLAYKKAGTVVTTGTSEISADGQTITLTLNTAGMITVGVYKKRR